MMFSNHKDAIDLTADFRHYLQVISDTTALLTERQRNWDTAQPSNLFSPFTLIYIWKQVELDFSKQEKNLSLDFEWHNDAQPEYVAVSFLSFRLSADLLWNHLSRVVNVKFHLCINYPCLTVKDLATVLSLHQAHLVCLHAVFHRRLSHQPLALWWGL